MAGKENKPRKVLYGEESDRDSILFAARFVRIILILLPFIGVVWMIIRIGDGKITPILSILSILMVILGILFALLVGKALEELARLAEENARLRRAVEYLCQTHEIELRSFDETPPQEIPGVEGDGFETMRIEEDGVHFRRAGSTVRCPFCEHEQPAGTPACENCGQSFFFEY